MDAATRSALFDVVADLARERPLRATSLAERLGLAFALDPSTEGRSFRIYKAAGESRHPPGVFIGAELREPAQVPKEGPVSALLILEVDRRLGVSEADVRQRFGPNPELSVPSPHAPPDAPLYWVYRQGAATVSFGFTRSDPVYLVSVMVNSIPGR